jgi:hypothetical protein
VETTDVVFAIDSIPAIFGVTKDPFIVFTSNVFAILGLRSLYFALSGVMGKFHYLKTALAFILAFIGVKMLLGHTDYKIETPLALGAVVGSLLVAVLMSLVKLKTWQSGLLLTMLLGAIGLVLDFFTRWDGAATTFYGMALGSFLVSILVTILHRETEDASTVELPAGHAEHSPVTDESDAARIHR